MDLYAGGNFCYVDSRNVNGAARWNGMGWLPLGAGIVTNGESSFVHDLTSLGNGDLIVAGSFDTAGGSPVANVARWDGTRWSSMDAGLDGAVSAIVPLANGRLVAGGSFSKSIAGGVLPGFALWNGTAWTSITGLVPLPTCFGGPGSVSVSAVTAMGGGRLLVAGDFAVAGIANHLAWWDSNTSAWSGLGDSPGSATDVFWGVRTMTRVAADRFVVAGLIYRAGDQDVSNVAM